MRALFLNRIRTMSIKSSTTSFWEDFKAFAIKGNVVDLAVAVVIGGAFGKIVTSFVGDIIMPLIGVLTGGVDFSKEHLILRAAVEGKPAVTLAYGSFIQTIIDFFIIALAIYLAIKGVARLRASKEVEAPKPPPAKSDEVLLLEEIRDLLKNK